MTGRKMTGRKEQEQCLLYLDCHLSLPHFEWIHSVLGKRKGQQASNRYLLAISVGISACCFNVDHSQLSLVNPGKHSYKTGGNGHQSIRKPRDFSTKALNLSTVDGRGVLSESVKQTRRVPSKYTSVGGGVPKVRAVFSSMLARESWKLHDLLPELIITSSLQTLFTYPKPF